VKGTEYFDGKTKGYVDSPVTDILQMMGRAGRPQFDSSAIACIFVHEPKKNFYRKFLHEPFPVESSLHTQLHEHINAEIANGTIHSLQDAVEYLTWTYFFRRLIVNPSYYQLEDSSPAGIQTFLSEMISKVVSELEDASCLKKVNDDSIIEHYEPTSLGRITSYYYLQYHTPFKFSLQFRQLHAHMLSIGNSDEDIVIPVDIVMKMMTDAAEFSELPVRHNEEFLNAELAAQLGFSTSSPLLGPMESPHTKAFLLLHAHQRKEKLPIADYINDTKTVFDQVPRVLNAMIDVAAEEGLLPVVFALVKLSQLLNQVSCIQLNI
jgi:activating signal cointegrator complex subunit 3